MKTMASQACIYEATLTFDFDIAAVFNDQRSANFFIDKAIERAKNDPEDLFVSYVEKRIGDDRTQSTVTARFVHFYI